MHQTLGQSANLYIQDFITASLHILALGNERMRIELTQQDKVAWRNGMRILDQGHVPSLRIHISTVGTTLGTQTFHVNLCNHHLWFHRETLCLCEQLTVLVDHGIATIHHILRTLSKAAATVDITGNGTCTLLCQQRFQVFMLPYQLITCREVEDQVSTRQSQTVTWWCWSPHILTDLNAQHHSVAGADQQRVAGNGNTSTCKTNLCWMQIL